MNNLDFIGLFTLLSGFIIGLGAVTVIDIHGFLGRKSHYWTEATTRTHKVTKPLIWVGISLATLGGIIFFRNDTFVGIPLHLSFVVCVLIINGVFLSFCVSPYLLKKEKDGRADELLPKSWQNKIVASLILSALCWWSSLLLVTYHIIER